MKIAFSSLFLSVLLFTTTTEAANCSMSYYQGVLSLAQSVQRSSRACDRVINSNASSIAKLCSACRTPVLQMNKLERALRNHRSCFRDARSQGLFAELANARAAVSFMRRGCGY
jgi:hypothetical protein